MKKHIKKTLILLFCFCFYSLLSFETNAAPDGEELITEDFPSVTIVEEKELPQNTLNDTSSPANSRIYNAGQTRIHFICLPDQTDAILLESNGLFGLVDSGEDTDYPDNSDPRYPMRAGIVTNRGFEDVVIAYLQNLGVEVLEFYIGTHAHSDHIGSGDEILNNFSVKKLYLNEYNDSYISNSARLWDNQYVYDTLIQAAVDNDVTIIQDFSITEHRNFSLGDMEIEIMNYERDYDKNGKIVPQWDENNNSLGVKISAYGQTAFLAGDINNLDKDGKQDNKNGDESRLAPLLGQINLLKLGHHGFSGSNTQSYLNTLRPEHAIVTGALLYLNSSTLNQLLDFGSTIQSIRWYDPGTAIIANFSSETISIDSPNSDYLISPCQPDNTLKYAIFKDGTIYYPEKGWLTYNNNTYFVDEDGFLVTGWLKYNDIWYYFDSAILQTGWQVVNSKTYYFNEDGEMQTGWLNQDSSWYYLDQTGAMQTGWLKRGSFWYYLNSSGVMQTGWGNISGKSYYFTTSGAMLTGWQKIGNNWFFFTGSGAMQTGWLKQGSTWYYLNSTGAMLTGWGTVSGKWYYFNASGAMRTGWQKIGNHWYFLAGSGAMQTGWLKQGSTWYYLNSSGAMLTGWGTVSGKWYYFNASGAMRTGWQKIGNHWYFLAGSGAMQTGWLKRGNTWYYLNSSGAMLSNTSANLGGKIYYFSGSGACTNPY